MKKIFLLTTSLFLILTLVFCYTSCATVKTDEIAMGDETLDVAQSETNGNSRTPKKLMLNAEGQTTRTPGYASQTIIATISPSDATIKDIIWSIEWEDSSLSTESINEIYEVIPTHEGSNVAEIRCYKEAYYSNAILTATTVDGGYTASCKVRFMGKPANMHLSHSTLLKDEFGNFLISSTDSNNYYFDIEFSNIFGYVHTTYKNCSVEIVSLTGNVVAAEGVEDGSGYLYVYPNTEKIISLEKYKHCFDVRVINGQLRVSYDFSDFETSTEVGSSDETYRNEMFKEFISGEEYVMTIRLTNNTGLREIVTFKFTTAVNGVSLDQDEIIF